VAFQIPKFNIWVQVFQQGVASRVSVGYSRAQIRAPRPSLVGRFYNIGFQLYDLPYVEVLFPAGSDIRSYQYARNSGPVPADDGMIIIPLGNINTGYVVQGVFDVGSGFPNEFRVALCRITDDVTLTGSAGMRRVNPALEPPVGYTPLPVLGLAT